MGGGSLYNFNQIHSNSNLLDEEQDNSKKLLYNPFLAHTSTTTSIASIYPRYDPNDFQLDPIPLTAPELPPRPEAYRNLNQPNTTTTNNNIYVNNQPTITVSNTSIPTNNNNHPFRLIYTKSGFYLKDTNPFVNSRIHGFFSILSKSMENIDIMIAWIPEYLIDPQDLSHFIQLDGKLAADEGYPTIHLDYGQDETMIVALKNIESFYIRPPTTRDQSSIVITSRSGDILKSLWYQSTEFNTDPQLDISSWPGYDIIDILGCFNPIRSSRNLKYVYVVENQNDPMACASSVQSFSTTTSSRPTQSVSERHEDPITKTIKEARWTLLERLSKITQYSKDTAYHVLEHPITRPIIPLLPNSLQSLFKNNRTAQTTLGEYQMASHYLERWGQQEQQKSDYYLADDVDGLLLGMPELCGPTPIHTRRKPVSPEEWVTFFDDDGKLMVSKEHVQQLVFRGGLDSDIRIEAWKYLLGIYPWESTFNEREAIRRSQVDAYFETKSHWFDHPEIRNTREFEDEKHRIDKDVHRTDRSQEAFSGEDLPNPDPQMVVGTNANLEIMKDILVTYNFYNKELGYVQGMSDLLAPLFVAMGDEAMAFWAFTKFMDRVQSNFYIDQSGMHGQLNTLQSLIQFMDPELFKHLEKTDTSNLFVCFRWLLVWFKREFEWEDVIRLWEVLWTDYLTDKMVLFIALAVIDAHRQTILKDLGQFDEILRYINDLTGKIPLESTLERAEVLFYQFERKIRAMQHKKSLLEQQLELRSVWNSSERFKIQERIEKLKIPENLLTLLPPLPNKN